MLDNPTRLTGGAVCRRHEVPGGRITDVEVSARAIKCDDFFQEHYCAHNVGLEEVYPPAVARTWRIV